MDSRHQNLIAEHILDRAFETTSLGKKWVPDITYVRLKDRWAYVTVILDLADRAVVAWSISRDMSAAHTVMAAWADARRTRSIQPRFVLHSDRGVQYSCKQFVDMLSLNTYSEQSMSRKGNCWDQALAESFIKLIKYE